jgi:glycyl-tRNA synthetase alpha subunit
MSALVAKLQEQYEDQYQRSITPVELRQLNSVESTFTLNKPSYAVLDTENNKAIHLHGANYQLIPYEKILSGLSTALDKYEIDISDTSIKFNVSPDLNYMKLRILFGDTGDFGTYSMSHNENDKLKFGIEVISSYDASIIYQLRSMFLRLICANGMKSFEDINSSMKRHTLNFNLDDSFTKLKNLNTTFSDMKNKVEVYQSVELSRQDVEKLFRKFSNNSDGKYHLLNNVLETDANKSTLYDVYNALTNYSSHNETCC